MNKQLFLGQTSFHRGKVRDSYFIDNKFIVAVTTDRISAFDVVLPKLIPFKGQVLNETATYNLNLTRDIVPNWLMYCPHPQVSIGMMCDTFKIEMIVRGMITGSGWRAYKEGKRDLCGNHLPDDMREYQRFASPIVTPTTKESRPGHHDQNITPGEIIESGLASALDYDQLYHISLALFQRGQRLAKERGLILVDTKYEFGKIGDTIYLIDEVHTPDSSRYIYTDGYEDRFEKGEKQKELSKEFVRQWLISHGFSGEEGQQVPEMNVKFIESISDRYIELYERFMDKKFQPDLLPQTETGIEAYLEEHVAPLLNALV